MVPILSYVGTCSVGIFLTWHIQLHDKRDVLSIIAALKIYQVWISPSETFRVIQTR